MKPVRILLTALPLLIAPNIALAVLPPDLLFSIGSQFAAIIGAIGVIVTGVVGALLASARESMLWLSLHRKIVLSGVFMLLFAVCAGVFLWARDNNRATPLVMAGSSSGEFRYSSDRFVISGMTPEGGPFLLDVSLNRKGIPEGGFIHYYLVSAIDGKKRAKESMQRDALAVGVLPDLLLSDFSRTVALDHSTRESYMFELPLFGETYTFATGEFVGDFIEKNEPEYTLYISAGTTSVRRGDQTFTAQIMHERAYSSDYRPTVFFAGSDTLSSESIQLILWDKEGNFYLIDRSRVDEPSDAYTSHYWALMKKVGGFSKKAFSGEAEFLRDADKPEIHASVPDFLGATFRLSLEREFEDGGGEGYVSGTMTDSAGVHMLFGEGYRHFYGQ